MTEEKKEAKKHQIDYNVIYVHVYSTGEQLICSFDKPHPTMERPTFKQAMRVTPNYVAFAEEGDTLIFSDMTIIIKENLKNAGLDEDFLDALTTAGDAFKEWRRLLNRLESKERLQFLKMVYNEGFKNCK